jgi:uncharacterized membrane protein YkoI
MQSGINRVVGTLALSCVASLAAAQSNPAVLSDFDYSQLPPDPKALEAELGAFKMDAAAAMKTAIAATGGKVMTMRILKNKDKIDYEVLCIQDGMPARVLINAKTGDMTVAKLDAITAVEKAAAAVPGKVGNVDNDLMADPPQWKVSIFAAGKSHLVSVNAIDGSVIADHVAAQLPGEATELPMQGEYGGLQWIVLKEGSGASPKGPDSMVKVNYTGYLVNGTPVDSTIAKGKPAEFRLDRMIKGWQQGVQAMKIGEKRKLIIPWNMAFGEQGRPPVIPPKATLIFDIELLDADMPPPAPKIIPPAAPPGGTTTPGAGGTTTPPAGGAAPPRGG